jgi:exodeoxyribonuclease VII large subunit
MGYYSRREIHKKISTGEKMSFTISEILEKTKELIENHPEIGGYISIIGEIGTIKIYGKHAYMSLKDESSTLKAVYFNISSENRVNFKEGTLIEAFGYISIYKERGEFQLYIKSARELSKTGLLRQKFEEQKQRLINEGIIPRQETERRKLPEFPEKIGIITSRNGAALHDIIQTFKKIYPELTLQIFHTGVQGKVEKQIIQAISNAEGSDVDCLIIARGGGSLEDLWCFNDENVVKKIKSCKKPVISGIGHETDHTLSEYAADYIASTPTAAAMIAVPNIFDFLSHKSAVLKRAEFNLQKKLNDVQIRLLSVSKNLLKRDPEYELQQNQKKLDYLIKILGNHIDNKFNVLTHRLSGMKAINKYSVIETRVDKISSKMLVLKEKINASNPDKYLELGYSRVEKDKIPVLGVVQLNTGDLVNVLMKDGEFTAEVKRLKKL